jgi:predicted metalloprotease
LVAIVPIAVLLHEFGNFVGGSTTSPLTAISTRTSAAVSTRAPPITVARQHSGPGVTTRFVPALPQSIRTYSTWDEFVADARRNVNDYWLHQPFPMDRRYAPPGVSLLQAGDPIPCGPQAPRGASFYCQNTQTIYLDLQSYALAKDWAGYAGLYVTLAHEWTHHIQFLMRVPYNWPNYELQADCGSGMFLAADWPSMTVSDLQAVRRMFVSTPSDTLHGSPSQRLAAFDEGYTHGATLHCSLPLVYS